MRRRRETHVRNWGQLRLTSNLFYLHFVVCSYISSASSFKCCWFCMNHYTVSNHFVTYASFEIYFLDSNESTVSTHFGTPLDVKL